MIDVCIQHHPRRADLLPPLLAQLPAARVISDPDPANPIPSPWRTYRACLEQPVESSHRLILQDDVTVCRYFLQAIEVVTAACPDNIVALFAGSQAYMGVHVMQQACQRGQPFANWPPGLWVPVVAALWPTAVIERVLAWVDKQRYKPHFRADDEIIGRAASALRIPVLATVPSLVEHPDEVPSLKRVGKDHRKSPDRSAWCYIGDDNPLEIAWAR